MPKIWQNSDGRGGTGADMNTIKLTDNIHYHTSTNVFVHTPTGYILHPDTILGLGYEEIVQRLYRATRWWLLQEDYQIMKDYIKNVETIYI